MSDTNINVVNIIKEVFDNNQPSDIHIGSGKCVSIRVNGEMALTESSILDEASIWNFVSKKLTEEEIIQFKKNGSIDFALVLGDLRFRANAYKTLKGTFCALRIIPMHIPDFKVLTGTAKLSLNLKDYPASSETASGLSPISITSATTKVDVRARARLINLKVENDAVNETWRFGTFRADIQPDGRR